MVINILKENISLAQREHTTMKDLMEGLQLVKLFYLHRIS
uniref:Uncharacterized protein n=1 Tax=Podoviridae sp. ct8Lf7 TaxID=2827723 RepID=A0A8S5S148_9CAUD|nr:MAG TPA: hypothetical protein [Podoviridae sp. ct8Lf7]